MRHVPCNRNFRRRRGVKFRSRCTKSKSEIRMHQVSFNIRKVSGACLAHQGDCGSRRKMTKMTQSMSFKGSRTRLAVLLAVTSCVGFAFVFDLRPASFASSVKNADVPNEAAVGLTEPQNYSRFRHNVSEHTRLPCLLCHKRDDNSPSMKFSGHLPCAG